MSPEHQTQEIIVSAQELASYYVELANLFDRLKVRPVVSAYIAKKYSEDMLNAVMSTEVGIFCNCEKCKKEFN